MTRDLTAQGAPAISMSEAVGYDAIECAHQTAVDEVLVLKHDRLFLLTDSRGCIAPPGQCGLGLFHDDTRILSHYALRFGSAEPLLLSIQHPTPYQALVDCAVDDRTLGGDSWDPRNVIHIRRELLLDDRLSERLTVTSYLVRPIDFQVELLIGCDFADIFEVRGWRRQARGQFFQPQVEPRRLTCAYRGRDGQLLTTVVQFVEPPTRLTSRGAAWQLRLEPGVRYSVRWEVATGESASQPALSMRDRRGRLSETYSGWRTVCARWKTDVAEFNKTISQAVDDLRSLYVHADGEEVISAGIPWYSTIFGRDSIITSLQTLPLNPQIARSTLRYLARHQGTTENAFTEEQPGKIMHELRRGEMARTGEIPHVPYYGTIDATPLWLVLLHETWRWTADEGLVRPLLPNAERALEWIDRYGDVDGDGLVEYARTSEKGLVNQGWKDSSDGVPFPDGALPEPPIALVEVQGYVYDAKLRMAQLFEAMGERSRAAELADQAAAMRERIQRSFWMDDVGTYALALDGAKRPIPTITSNAGHLLWSRVADAAQAERMSRVFAGPEMFSGWGIRTLSSAHAAFNPMSYHDGSVWPHDNALVVMGLSHYGHAAEALPVLCGLHDAATHMRFQRLPELFCGMQRAGGMRPVLYPVSCSPQAWASGAFFMLLQAVLGLLPDAPRGVLHIRNPQLPRFLRELTIHDLQVGGSRVSLRFERHGQRTLANLLALEGAPLKVRITLS